MTRNLISPEGAMRMALAQARRRAGRTWPNPSVGAVVYRGHTVLGRGTTVPGGGPHAEIVAIAKARKRHGPNALRGASMAVTLEPCCTEGRTGPCTEALIEAGLRRIAIGCRDSHATVSGRGIRRLRRAGLEVAVGVGQQACRQQHRGFLSVQERRRPFVSLKLAATLDGRIATETGESRWITGPAAREYVQRLRARSDAVAVGSGTARADDPRLEARIAGRAVVRPVRVLFDAKLRVPSSARVYRTADVDRTWVLCASGARGAKVREQLGARVLACPARGAHLDLRKAMGRLAREGLTEVLVEGGGELAAALLDQDLVDEVHWFVATRLLGGQGRPSLGPMAGRRLADVVKLHGVRTRKLGDDVLFSGLIGDFP